MGVELCGAVLGPKYEIVELGFDVPFQGAKFQPWHRDFPSPRRTYEGRALTSLACSLTLVDVTEEIGPFEIAPGTQHDDGRSWKHEMFPPQSEWERYAKLGVQHYRSAATSRRGRRCAARHDVHAGVLRCVTGGWCASTSCPAWSMSS